MTVDEIARHMDYPDPGKPCEFSGRPFDDDGGEGGPSDESRPKRQKREPPKPPPPPPGGSGGSGWLGDVSGSLPDAVRKANTAKEKRMARIKETPRSGSEERLVSQPLPLGRGVNKLGNCQVDVKFCDKDRLVKDTFSSLESVCVPLKVANTTASEVAVPITPTIFGRGGMHLDILDGNEVRAGTPRMVFLHLKPGDHYTFFCFLTMGVDYQHMYCTKYETPKSGDYEAKVICTTDHGVFKFPGVHKFSIRN